MPIEVKEMIIRATVEKGDSETRRPGTREREQGSQGINDCLTKIEEMKKMILEKNER